MNAVKPNFNPGNPVKESSCTVCHSE